MDGVENFRKEMLGNVSRLQRLINDGLENITRASELEEHETQSCEINNYFQLDSKASSTEKIFSQLLLQTMEENKLPKHLHNHLKEQQESIMSILNQYDTIVNDLTADLHTTNLKCKLKLEEQSKHLDVMRNRIEKLVAEICDVGKTEVSDLRDSILKHSKLVFEENWSEIKLQLDKMAAEKPLDPFLWEAPAAMLSLGEVENTFYSSSNEKQILRNTLSNEICQLRQKLQQDKLSYTLKKERFKQEICLLNRKCSEGKPLLAKMKRKSVCLRDRVFQLQKDIAFTKDLINKEEERKRDLLALRKQKQRHRSNSKLKFKQVSEDMREERDNLQSEVNDKIESLLKDFFENQLSCEIRYTFEEAEKESCEKPHEIIAKDTSKLRDILGLLGEYRNELQQCQRLHQENSILSGEVMKYRSILSFYHKFKS